MERSVQYQIGEAIALLERDPLGQHRTALVRGTLERAGAELAITKDERARAQHACELMGARINRLEDLVRVLIEHEPDDMAADAVTVLDVWRADAEAMLRYDWGAKK